jgi:hypothetical protein
MELTPGLRRRRERAEHQKNLILEQLVNGVNGSGGVDPDSPTNNLESPDYISLRRSSGSRKDLNSLEFQNNMKNSGSGGGVNGNSTSSAARPWMLPIYTKSNGNANSTTNISNVEDENGDSTESEMSAMLKRENTVKDLTQKLASQNLLASPAEENKSFINNGELSGMYMKML